MDASLFSIELRSTQEEIQAIRRACFELVPTMVIVLCTIHANDSLLKPKILMQRLACVPIRIDADAFVYKETCACESFCARCSIRGTIRRRGGRVLSDAIAGAEPGIPIVVLGDDQEIHFDWVALKGTGRDSPYHCPVSVVIARQLRDQLRDSFELRIESIQYPAKTVYEKALRELAAYMDRLALTL